jgi:uncharacterized damage-inducible protein DinB
MNAKDWFGHWAEVRSGLVQALDQLHPGQLDFVPRAGLWSLRQTACHIAGAEEGWFRYIVTHELNGWEAADFDPADYPDVPALKRLLEAVHARTLAFLETVDEADVDRQIELPWGPTAPLRWIIWHVLEHEIHHRGEIFLMLGLMGMEAPDV